MERVSILIQKLQEQHARQADPQQMLITVQMLQKELAGISNGHVKSLGTRKVAVTMPHSVQGNMFETTAEQKPAPAIPPVPEPPAPVIAEKPAVAEKPAQSAQPLAAEKPVTASVSASTTAFDPLVEVPTLTHQPQADTTTQPAKEINDTIAAPTESLNDKLKQDKKTELSEVLTDAPVKDLRKAIGINDRFLFINELFRGDEVMYERSIKTINGFRILAEAEYWMERELKVKLGWSDKSETVQVFMQLVKRRFA
jgi:DNA polymerase III gamma/tau subunit